MEDTKLIEQLAKQQEELAKQSKIIEKLMSIADKKKLSKLKDTEAKIPIIKIWTLDDKVVVDFKLTMDYVDPENNIEKQEVEAELLDPKSSGKSNPIVKMRYLEFVRKIDKLPKRVKKVLREGMPGQEVISYVVEYKGKDITVKQDFIN